MNAPAPMKIGMYLFEKVMTQHSTPVVVTVAPGRVVLVTADRVLADMPAHQLSTKVSKVLRLNELHGPWGKWMLGGLGAAKSPEFTEAQAREIVDAQEAAARDPHASQLELAHTVWVGRPTVADGSRSGGLNSVGAGESRMQPRIAPILDAALLAAGVRRT
ncbi:MAG: hypothetical protein Q4F53_05725 [Nesterenkonia sp.]|uniref:hypothetical protein n=1 Tax=Nesterenkonia marinintestina TaxID=2979865 RepID=UPI0021BEC8D3|nr:hypothetical protein [Nesterenkonia sp. GX14115]MDO5493095.1 hypothetical protein [Nesterenkonia sp.]